MKKIIFGIALLSILTTSLSGCDLFFTKDAGDLLAKENANTSSDNSSRFNETIPSAYFINEAYDYNDYHDHCYYTINNTPTIGNINLLVIPVRLKGYDLKNEGGVRQDIYTSFFGDSNDLAFESVASYFKKSSYGAVSIGGCVTDWYDTTYDVNITQDETALLVEDATNWAKQQYKSDLDFTIFDSNKDGFLDGVVLVYNAPSSYKENENLWAYCSWLYNLNANKNSPIARQFLWASQTFMYENISNNPLDAHTYIHEVGHLFGLDDYYDYSKSNYAGASGGAIMQSYNVGDHDPYSKFALGWIDPIVPTGDTTITLKPFSESGQTILLTNRSNLNSAFDEYILIDFYSASNLNQYDSTHRFGGNRSNYPLLPTSYGVRIWHVDARLMNINKAGDAYYITSQIDDEDGRYYHLNSNSSEGSYASMDVKNRDNRLLRLISRTFINSYETTKNTFFSSSDMFKEGDKFSVNRYNVLFKNNKVLNDGTSLNFEIEVMEMNNEQATIDVRVI